MEAAEPVVFLADHETKYTVYTEAAVSFTQWLEKSRF